MLRDFTIADLLFVRRVHRKVRSMSSEVDEAFNHLHAARLGALVHLDGEVQVGFTGPCRTIPGLMPMTDY